MQAQDPIPPSDADRRADALPPELAEAIAIVGVAGRFPSARNARELWSLLDAGREATRWLTPEQLRAAGVAQAEIDDPHYVRATLELPDMEMFDAEFFGFSRRDAAVLDPQHRHFLECAWEALEDAGHMPEHFDGAIGVFGGCGMQAYLPYNLLTNPQLVKSMGLFLLRHTGNDKDFLCSRVSYLLDLKGPSVGVQTACSTSLVAVHMAAQSLLSGECDMALAGGVSIELPHRQGYAWAEGEILSPDGHCRAFDDDAGGTLFGSGAGIVVLRRLADAVRDRDNIYAVIRGSAVNNDGSRKAGYLAPSVEGQARAAVEALGIAGVEPETVEYIEAHGTGTPVGDPIELAALSQAYAGAPRGGVRIGSLKTNIGHLDTAAGVASLIKVALAMRNGVLPASLNYTRPNSRFAWNSSPFRVANERAPWPRGAKPRRAGVNSLGVGGTNAHVIVEEAPVLAAGHAQPGDGRWHAVLLSARTPAALDRLKASWRDFLDTAPAGLSLADAAFTTQEGRRAFPHRCALVARDLTDLRAVLAARTHARSTAAQARGDASTHGSSPDSASAAPGIAFMFPGGGAHYPGAARELLKHAAFRDAVDECLRLLPAGAPKDLRTRMFEGGPSDTGAAATLERPSYALPALFIVEYALAKLWESWGVRPAALIGHSAGEYAAACIAGVMTLADALSVVALRGRLFEEVPLGGMLSVDLAEGELRTLMEGLDLDIAAINARDLCIASGPLQSIARLERRLAERGIEGRRLHINVAAHSRLLDGVLDAFRAQVSRIRLSPPTIPFVSNLTGTWAQPGQLEDPEYWVQHLRNPVRFSDGVRALLERDDLVLLETGPGQGLCALAGQNSEQRRAVTIASTCKAQETQADEAQMLTAAGALWSHGVAVDWKAVRGATRARRVSLPTYPFERERHWVEPGLVVAASQSAAPQEAQPAIERIASADDWFFEPAWTPAAPPALPQAAPQAVHWLVFGNRSTLTPAVAAAARVHGEVTLVQRGDAFVHAPDGTFTVDPRNPVHYRELFDALSRAGRVPSHVVMLWPLDTLQASANRRIAGQTLAFDSLVNLAQVLGDMESETVLSVVTAGSQCVSGEAVPHPERALALGPCRVIPREMPHVRTRLIDFAPFDLSSPDAARRIVAECLSPEDSAWVAWRAATRFVAGPARRKPHEPQSAPVQARVRRRGAYLITGGLGEIGLELASWLATHYEARLALVARRRLPVKASWRGIAASGDTSAEARLVRKLVALEDQGAQVSTFSADVADADAMARVVAECRSQFGGLDGVFHAAGVLDDSLLAVHDAAAMQRVLDPKVAGAQVLHELLPPGDLDVFAVFSSTSIYLANAGQAAYVAANAYLAALAASRADGLAIHWGIWAERGMAARALGRAAHGMPAGTHPLLGARIEPAAGGDASQGATFESQVGPRHTWVLAEHKVGGSAVLPGTAYIEMARAALAAVSPGRGIEIRALSFEEAMVFEGDAQRTVRTQLQREGDSYAFVVRSRGPMDEHWHEHARARLAPFDGALPQAAPPAPVQWQEGSLPQASNVAFGARWNNVRRMHFEGTAGTAQLELAERFEDDLEAFAAHPALTDMAATFGLHLVDAAQRRGNLFVPLSVDRICIVAPVPRCCTSRVRLHGATRDRLAAFDVAIHGDDGRCVATFEGFTLRGVPASAVARSDGAAQPTGRREPSLAEAMLAAGIRAQDAPQLFARILSQAGREVIVSSIDLGRLAHAIEAAQPRAPARRSRTPASGPASQAAGEDFNTVERAIADIWRDLLGAGDIGRDDDFFALGGHSLAAVRLFARIRKNLNVDLPLATLFQAPTLGALAAVVAQAGNIETQPDSGESRKANNVIPLAKRAWSPLVTICRGEPDRRPLFCVHGAGGNVLNFKLMSDRLGSHQPFYGLQAQGADGRMPPLTSVEAMASQYVEAIKGVEPLGPYRLAGYSAGGVIALEMAHQLVQTGARVELLAMIDTLAPAAAARPVPMLRKLWLARHWSLGFLLDWPGRRKRGRELQHHYTQALEKLSRGEPLPHELIEHHLFRNFVDAQARFRPAAYDGDMVLFKATESEMQYLGAGRTLGWDEVVRGAIRVTEIAGSHFSMMAEPGLSELVEGLRAELARVDGGVAPAPPREEGLAIAPPVQAAVLPIQASNILS